MLFIFLLSIHLIRAYSIFMLATEMYRVIHPLLFFVLDYEKLALLLSGDVMKPKCVCVVERLHVIIPFLFGVINNSDNQKRYNFITVAKHCAILQTFDVGLIPASAVPPDCIPPDYC